MSAPLPTKRPKWLWPVLGGVAVLLILCGGGTIFLYVTARSTIDAAVGPTPLVSAAPSDDAGAGTGEPEPGESSEPVVEPRASLPSLPTSTGVPCQFTPLPGGGANPRAVSPPPARAPYTGKITATLHTGQGPVVVSLDADRAPCTVHSFIHLAQEDYFTETSCHRLTTSGLFVLQCGDPTGTGTGNPGYQFPDENLPTSAVPYPRGTLAMANAGPGTNGSQFFLVFRDSDIQPDYTVFGTVTSGLDVLDKVAAAGTAEGGTDGRPSLGLTLDDVRIG